MSTREPIASRWRRAPAPIAAALLALALVGTASIQIARPGYSPDEEFTIFAVRGIAAHGLPLLPSGLLYDRGAAYSYAAGAVSALGLSELQGGRIVSLLTAVLALLGIRHVVGYAVGHPAGWAATVLVASSLPFWVAATSARFYAPFLACHVGVLVLLARIDRAGSSPPVLLGLVVVAALARLSHELAFTLAAVPAAALVLSRHWRRWVAATGAIVAGLAGAQALVFALHFLAPESGATMIRRFFVWQVINLLARPPAAAPLGALLVIALAWLLARGGRSWAPATSALRRIALVVTALVLAWAVAPPSLASLAYPLDLFWYLAQTMPALVLALLGLLAARAAGAGGPWRPLERAAHLLWLGWVVFFGVIESGITIHYVLAPATFMLAAVAIDAVAVARHQAAHVPGAARVWIAAGVVLLTAVAVAPWLPRPARTLDTARPTLVAPPGLPQMAAEAPRVACTDELACLLLAGRVDRWLALDDFLRERFVISRHGQEVGVYAGRPAVFRLTALFEEPDAPPRVLVIDVPKTLPIGSSAAFLDRALAEEDVTATPLLTTPDLRVFELARP